jgi:type IV secretory pathway VirB6-like protein
MARYWKRRGRGSDLESVLRESRPEPSAEFIRLLTGRINESRRHVAGRRIAVAAAVTLLMVAALTAFGGIGYAATAAEQVTKIARNVTGQNTPATTHRGKPSHDQYQEERKQCRRAEQQRHQAALREIRQAFQECRQGVQGSGDRAAPRGAAALP